LRKSAPAAQRGRVLGETMMNAKTPNRQGRNEKMIGHGLARMTRIKSKPLSDPCHPRKSVADISFLSARRLGVHSKYVRHGTTKHNITQRFTTSAFRAQNKPKLDSSGVRGVEKRDKKPK
jgi:hypothetical protein